MRRMSKAKRKNKRWTNAEDEQLLSLWGEVRRGDHVQRRRIAKGLGRTEASCGQNVKQKIVIQDTIDKMEVLLGRLRKVLE